MTEGILDAPYPAAQPVARPRGIHLVWYALGGSLPSRHHSWVLGDLTCRTWWLRHFARTAVVVVPLLAVYLAFVPASLGIRLLTGLTFAAAGFVFSFVNILVDTDRRAVRAGHASGLAEQIRNTRAAERHRVTSYQRRERIAERQARRRTVR
jgi:hypothetical protein